MKRKTKRKTRRRPDAPHTGNGIRSRSEVAVVRTIAAAAARLGYSQAHVKAIRDAGAPGFKANGAIDTKAVKAWMLENPTKLPAPSNWKDALGMEKLRGEKRANDLAEGMLIEKTRVAEQFQKLFRPALARVEQMLVNEYPSKVSGLDVPAARVYGKRVLDMILETFREGALGWQS